MINSSLVLKTLPHISQVDLFDVGLSIGGSEPLTIKNIKSIYVKSYKAKVEKNKIVEYRALVKIAFVVQREE